MTAITLIAGLTACVAFHTICLVAVDTMWTVVELFDW